MLALLSFAFGDSECHCCNQDSVDLHKVILSMTKILPASYTFYSVTTETLGIFCAGINSSYQVIYSKMFISRLLWTVEDHFWWSLQGGQ